jgi:hypothetical protein
MEKPILLCLFPIVIFLSACNFYTTKEKIATYKKISEINDSLDNMTTEWHRLLDNAVSGKNYTALRPYRLEMASFLNRNRSVVAYLKMTPLSENLIDSEESFLDNQATMVSDLYSNFEIFNDMTPDETIQGQLKQVVGDQAAEQAGSAAIKKSLSSFSKKNDLKKKMSRIK